MGWGLATHCTPLWATWVQTEPTEGCSQPRPPGVHHGPGPYSLSAGGTKACSSVTVTQDQPQGPNGSKKGRPQPALPSLPEGAPAAGLGGGTQLLGTICTTKDPLDPSYRPPTFRCAEYLRPCISTFIDSHSHHKTVPGDLQVGKLSDKGPHLAPN